MHRMPTLGIRELTPGRKIMADYRVRAVDLSLAETPPLRGYCHMDEAPADLSVSEKKCKPAKPRPRFRWDCRTGHHPAMVGILVFHGDFTATTGAVSEGGRSPNFPVLFDPSREKLGKPDPNLFLPGFQHRPLKTTVGAGGPATC